MYSVAIIMEYTGLATMFESVTGQSIGQRALANFVSHANRQMAIYWHQTFLPDHFNAAQRKYENQRRKPPYADIKKQLATSRIAVYNGRTIREKQPVQRGGVIDNVRKGLTERQARSSPGIFASKTRATVTMFVPRYAGIANRDPGKPNKAEEITRVAPEEYPVLKRVWTRVFLHFVRVHKNRILRRI